MLHVTPAQGSFAHWFAVHPKVQLIWVLVYAHVPPLQVPGAWGTFSVVALAHVGAGGLLHVTPRQGLPLHMPLAQPFVQGWVDWPYVHCPLSHVPTVA